VCECEQIPAAMGHPSLVCGYGGTELCLRAGCGAFFLQLKVSCIYNFACADMRSHPSAVPEPLDPNPNPQICAATPRQCLSLFRSVCRACAKLIKKSYSTFIIARGYI
jgi:hypothetical protein